MERTRHASTSPYETAYGFSRGVRTGSIIHIAGTAPIPEPGEPLAADAASQMRRCGDIALGSLRALGGTVSDVVRTRMYIVDPADADVIGTVHGELFGVAAPASTMIVVAALLDPAWKVEIEVEAVVGT